MDKTTSCVRFNVFTQEGVGSISVAGDAIELRAGKMIVLKKNYVDSVEKAGELGLNKVGVKFFYYDLFGNKEERDFSMNSSDFLALKKLLGK